MAGTIDYDSIHLICPHCNQLCEIVVVNTYDPHEDTDFSSEVAGYQDCGNCGYKFTNDDLDNEGV